MSESEVDHGVLDLQRQHWEHTYAANPMMFGAEPSEAGRHAIALFSKAGAIDILELGVGQGRDTLAFLQSGMRVTALDYAPEGLEELTRGAKAAGVADRLRTDIHDVRQPLRLPDSSVDGVFSHMLFNMALTTEEIIALAAEVRRVLRPGGLHIYTVRHVGDAHFGTGILRGDNMTEHGGFVVHFFDRALVESVAEGFTSPAVVAFEEGGLPRRLWRVTQRKTDNPAHSNHQQLPQQKGNTNE